MPLGSVTPSRLAIGFWWHQLKSASEVLESVRSIFEWAVLTLSHEVQSYSEHRSITGPIIVVNITGTAFLEASRASVPHSSVNLTSQGTRRCCIPVFFLLHVSLGPGSGNGICNTKSIQRRLLSPSKAQEIQEGAGRADEFCFSAEGETADHHHHQ